MDIPLDEIGRAVHSAGWSVVRLSPESPRSAVLLARPGSTPVETSDELMSTGTSPDVLRQNPTVRARAADIERTQGFDPLAEHNLEYTRARDMYWMKRFVRQSLLAMLYGFVGLFGLGVTFATLGPNSGNFYLSLAITFIVFALLSIALSTAVTYRRQRRKEIGDILDAYNELNQLNERS